MAVCQRCRLVGYYDGRVPPADSKVVARIVALIRRARQTSHREENDDPDPIHA